MIKKNIYIYINIYIYGGSLESFTKLQTREIMAIVSYLNLKFENYYLFRSPQYVLTTVPVPSPTLPPFTVSVEISVA